MWDYQTRTKYHFWQGNIAFNKLNPNRSQTYKNIEVEMIKLYVMLNSKLIWGPSFSWINTNMKCKFMRWYFRSTSWPPSWVTYRCCPTRTTRTPCPCWWTARSVWPSEYLSSGMWCRVQSTGYRVLGTGYSIQGTKYWVQAVSIVNLLKSGFQWEIITKFTGTDLI